LLQVPLLEEKCVKIFAMQYLVQHYLARSGCGCETEIFIFLTMTITHSTANQQIHPLNQMNIGTLKFKGLQDDVRHANMLGANVVQCNQ
jgi:hypothetical protein